MSRTRRYVPVVGPRLRVVLWIVFALTALIGVNSVYLVVVSLGEHWSGVTLQNYFYQWMFLVHLALGLLLTAPVVIFGIVHIRNAYDRPNRRAVRVGYALFVTALLLIASGFALARFDVGGVSFEIRDPALRNGFYWLHVVTPVVCVWLFVLHRLAG